mgnify:FL=1
MPLHFLYLISGPAVEVSRQALGTQDIDKCLGIRLMDHAGHFPNLTHIDHCVNQNTALAVVKSHTLNQGCSMVQFLNLGTHAASAFPSGDNEHRNLCAVRVHNS